MRNPCKMSLMELEMFLQHGSEDGTKRSLADPWQLAGNLLFEPDVFLHTLLLKAGECAPLFSNAATMYNMNKWWWEKHRGTFQKWWEVIDDEYNPLWTNDSWRTVEENTQHDGSSSTRSSGYSNSDGKIHEEAHDHSHDQSVSETKRKGEDHLTKDSSKNETENGVSAYDADKYSPHDISEGRSAHTSNADDFDHSVTKAEAVHNSSSTSGSAHIDHSSNAGESDTIDNDKQARQLVEHAYGNNSVMMTGQRLFEEEVRVRKINLYEMMADLFCDEMLVWVYT